MNGYGPRFNVYQDTGRHIRPGHRIVVIREDASSWSGEPEAGTVVRVSRAEASEGYTVGIALDGYNGAIMWYRPDEVRREGESNDR